jgi:hypothetical protein
MFAARLTNAVFPAGMPRTGLADNLLIAVGASLVGVALVAAIVLWWKRG